MSRFNFKAPAAVAGQLLALASSATVEAIENGVRGKEVLTPSMLAARRPEFPGIPK